METNDPVVQSGHIPAAQAEHIAKSYGKDVVVVFAWSREASANLIAIAYGTDEMAMFKAEDWLRRCSTVLGADLRSATFYEKPTEYTAMEKKLVFLSQKLGEFAKAEDSTIRLDAIEALEQLSSIR